MMTEEQKKSDKPPRKRGPKPTRPALADLKVFAEVLAEWRHQRGQHAIKVSGNRNRSVCDILKEQIEKRTNKKGPTPDYIKKIYNRTAAIKGPDGDTLLNVFLSDGELPPGPAGKKQKRELPECISHGQDTGIERRPNPSKTGLRWETPFGITWSKKRCFPRNQ